ncbi:MAG: N-acetylmuramoyl-L-alanine amidase [Paludibacter sp.]|nr:N-acetylmuramoyl-L-alanine amidase [Paludibacter sp.]
MNNLKIISSFLVRKQYKKITFAGKYSEKTSLNHGRIMKFIKNYFIVIQCAMILSGVFMSSNIFAQEARFTVVLDAGHGGHDPGAAGSISKEKDINLAVVLKLGEIIERNFRDVKVVYTRKTDKYLTLQERADVVNNNHANLFICIHTNAATSSSAYGAETFTLGLAKSKSNLDVAMRENSVILLEDDYKSKYKGFDPNSVDSYIMFEFMQDSYIDKSVEFSSIVQKQFVKYCRRSDRGVRQAGFWVLHRSACPSVLIELGFISNPAEERYLSADSGQKEMAGAIFNAFVDFKRDYDKKSGIQPTSVAKKEIVKHTDDDTIQISKETKNNLENKKDAVEDNSPANNTAETNNKRSDIITGSLQNPVFKVQLFATAKLVKSSSSEFKGVKNTDSFKEGGLYKYTVGAETDYNKIEQIRRNVLAKFPQAFIIAFVGDKKMSAKEALKITK